MDIVFYFSLAGVGIISAIVSLVPEKKIKKRYKAWFFFAICVCLFFQAWYGYQEKIESDSKDLRNQFTQEQLSVRQKEIAQGINELREKDKKGLLSDAEYGRYIAYYLENIDFTIKSAKWKNIREWVTAYYDEVGKIPSYFTPEEWKKSEQFIYSSFADEINENFNARNMYNSGIRLKVVENFNKERNRMLAAKEREFNGTVSGR